MLSGWPDVIQAVSVLSMNYYKLFIPMESKNTFVTFFKKNSQKGMKAETIADFIVFPRIPFYNDTK